MRSTPSVRSSTQAGPDWAVRMVTQSCCSCISVPTLPSFSLTPHPQQRRSTAHCSRLALRASCEGHDSSKRKLMQSSAALLLLPLRVQAAAQHQQSVRDVMNTLRVDFVERQYYVTGQLSSSIFSNDCLFNDPTTSVRGRQKYGAAVASLFDPSKSKADMISMTQVGEKAIKLKWRFEAALNVPGKPRIKPYLGTTLYTLDDNHMIIKQEEEWSIGVMDALVSLLFPGFGAPAAAPIEELTHSQGSL